MAHNRKCKITVIKCMFHEELANQYEADVSLCPLFKEGQSFILDQNSMSGYWHLMGGTFCSEAWASISNYVDTVLQGGTFNTSCKIASCPNGIHPVIFKIERFYE